MNKEGKVITPPYRRIPIKCRGIGGNRKQPSEHHRNTACKIHQWKLKLVGKSLGRKGSVIILSPTSINYTRGHSNFTVKKAGRGVELVSTGKGREVATGGWTKQGGFRRWGRYWLWYCMEGSQHGLQGPHPHPPCFPKHRTTLQWPIPSAVPSTLEVSLLHFPTMAKCHLLWEFHVLEHDSEDRKKLKGPWQSQSHCHHQVHTEEPLLRPWLTPEADF